MNKKGDFMYEVALFILYSITNVLHDLSDLTPASLELPHERMSAKGYPVPLAQGYR